MSSSFAFTWRIVWMWVCVHGSGACQKERVNLKRPLTWRLALNHVSLLTQRIFHVIDLEHEVLHSWFLLMPNCAQHNACIPGAYVISEHASEMWTFDLCVCMLGCLDAILAQGFTLRNSFCPAFHSLISDRGYMGDGRDHPARGWVSQSSSLRLSEILLRCFKATGADLG